MENQLEILATQVLENVEQKPNFSNRTFFNCLILFQNALMDKMYDTQEYDNMDISDRYKMAESCGNELSKLIYTYTNLDTHDLENFI